MVEIEWRDGVPRSGGGRGGLLRRIPWPAEEIRALGDEGGSGLLWRSKEGSGGEWGHEEVPPALTLSKHLKHEAVVPLRER